MGVARLRVPVLPRLLLLRLAGALLHVEAACTCISQACSLPAKHSSAASPPVIPCVCMRCPQALAFVTHSRR